MNKRFTSGRAPENYNPADIARFYRDVEKAINNFATSLSGIEDKVDRVVRSSNARQAVATGATGATGETGDPGSTGAAGNHTVFVYKRSSSTPDAPTSNGIPTGEGWSSEVPIIDGTALWWSSAEQTIANVLVGAWSAPVRIMYEDTPLIESFSIEWGNLTTYGQSILLDYTVTNGGDRIYYQIDDNATTSPPGGDGTAIEGITNSDQELATGIHFNEVKTVWLRASDGLVHGEWFRSKFYNQVKIIASEPIYETATDGNTSKRNVLFTFETDKKGGVKVEYVADTSISDPIVTGTTIGPFYNYDSADITNVVLSSFVASTDTLTKRYLHIRLKGHNDDLLTTGWKTILLPTINAFNATVSGVKNTVSGSTRQDDIFVDLSELLPGVTVYCDRVADGARIMYSVVDNAHDIQDGSYPYRYAFATKNYTDVSGIENAEYSIKVYDSFYNVIYSTSYNLGGE